MICWPSGVAVTANTALVDVEPLGGLVRLARLELGWCTRLAGDVAPLRGLVQVTRLTLEGCPGLTGDKKELTESVEAKRKAFAALSNREASFASRGSRVSGD